MYNNPVNNGVNYLSTGAGFLPSTATVYGFHNPHRFDIIAETLHLFLAAFQS